MRVFLTGYSGNLGRPIARSLVAAGREVRALFHGRAIDRRDLDPGIEVVWGSLTDLDRYDDFLRDVDAVVHCAWSFQRGESYEAVNLKTTLALLEASARAGISHFVSISSVAVYGLDAPLDASSVSEERPYVEEERSLDVYPWTKVRLERALTERAGELGVDLTIVRPGLLFSDEKSPAKAVFHLGRKRVALVVGMGGNHLPHVHVEDVASMVLLVLEKKQLGLFNAVPSRILPVSDFVKRWGRSRGHTTYCLRLPVPCFKAMGWGAYRLKRLLGKDGPPPNLRYQAATHTRNVRYSCKKAQEALGWDDTRTRAIAEA